MVYQRVAPRPDRSSGSRTQASTDHRSDGRYHLLVELLPDILPFSKMKNEIVRDALFVFVLLSRPVVEGLLQPLILAVFDFLRRAKPTTSMYGVKRKSSIEVASSGRIYLSAPRGPPRPHRSAWQGISTTAARS